MTFVTWSGGVFAATLFDQMYSPSSQEGLLLGHAQLHTRSTISDTDINTQSESLVYEIEKTIQCPTPRFFYNKSGHIIEEKLGELLNGRPVESVIGWYKCRQQNIIDMSLWDRVVSTNLHQFLNKQRKGNPSGLVFGLFITEPATTLSTRLQTTRFLILRDNGKYSPMKFHLRNLGNTSSHYKRPVSTEFARPVEQFKTVCDRHRARLIDEPHQTVHSTKQTDSMANEMCAKLRGLCSEVETSEVEVHTLMEEIEAMKKILCATISQSDKLDEETELQSTADAAGSRDSTANHVTNEGCLIDLTDVNGHTNNSLAAHTNNLAVHVDYTQLQPVKSSTSQQTKPASSDAFAFVDDVLDETKQLCSPQRQSKSKAKEPTDGGDTCIPSSPSSPIY